MYRLSDGQFLIGNLPVMDLVKEYGTPLYLYDQETIRERISELKSKLGVYPQTKFLYAIKANYNPHIVKFIISQGLGIDAVSIEDVKMALFCGAKPEDIMYTENNISDAEMKETQKLGALLNIGSLSRLEKFGQRFPGKNICLRINPEVGAGSHQTNITGGPDSKFGIAYKDFAQAIEISRQYKLNIIGLHQHIGSGWLETKEILRSIPIILQEALHVPSLKFVDFGGGFGVPYRPNQQRLDLAELGKVYAQKFTDFCKKYGRPLELRFEPGRYVVAEAGHLLAQVTTLKDIGKMIAGLNTGMNHLVRPAMYGSYHPVTNISNPEGKKKKYDVCGNVCESADFFAKSRMIPEIHEGDILSVEVAGAYGMSMASMYQLRPLPPEVLVSGSEHKLIRKRQTFSDILKNFV